MKSVDYDLLICAEKRNLEEYIKHFNKCYDIFKDEDSWNEMLGKAISNGIEEIITCIDNISILEMLRAEDINSNMEEGLVK